MGIWQAHDIYAIYVDRGISLGFLITSIACGVVIFLALLLFWDFWKHYRGVKGGMLYRSDEGRVEKTWQEKDGDSVTEYFNFLYKDLLTGEVKEHKHMNYGEKLKETDMGEVELTRTAYDYYKRQYETATVTGQITYYPHSKIFLYLLKEDEEEN